MLKRRAHNFCEIASTCSLVMGLSLVSLNQALRTVGLFSVHNIVYGLYEWSEIEK
jgi:hypothetical protein